jgi:hypothetical protein
MNALVVGWFSYESSDATAGDLLACDVVCDWLRGAGHSCDAAFARAFDRGVSLDAVSPDDYAVIVFVCGPFMRNHWEAAFFAQFAGRPIVGVNLSLPVPLSEWNLFDQLIERDSDRRVNPDLTYASPFSPVPVVGLCLVEPYGEARVDVADEAIHALCRSRDMAIVPIDTRLDVNQTGLRTAAEVESLLARMDAVITTRLHGTVLALKHGVPPLVVDPEPGGGRIHRQAVRAGWPVVFTVDDLDAGALEKGLAYCLSHDARDLARQCADRARPAIAPLKDEFLGGLSTLKATPLREARLAFAAAHGRS